jgi:hypothetical protein
MALTKFNYNSFDVTPVASKAMGFNSGANGLTSISPTSMVLIKEQTASSSATISFVDGTSDVVLDNTYPIYVFKFINIHPADDNADLRFQCSIDTGSNYNVAMTTTSFNAWHNEGDTSTAVQYLDNDQAQGTAFENLATYVGADNDQSTSGELWLFNPSSTTFVKHYLTRFNVLTHHDYNVDEPRAGYFNTTSAIDAIQFKFDSGNIDAGTIKLYGIKDS